MNPYTSRRRATPAQVAAFNAGVQRARDAHLNQATCHRCGALVDLIPDRRVRRTCEGCKEET